MTDDVLRHVDPTGPECPLALREAVVEGVVRRAHDRLTGRGVHGDVLFGDAPSRLLAAGFLLPARRQAAPDTPAGPENDATSPIHLSSVGMSFQIERQAEGEIAVTPQGAVYVRMLPTVEDLVRNPIAFGLHPDARRDLRGRKRDLLKTLCDAEGIPARGATPEQRIRIAELRADAGRRARSEWATAARLSPTVAASAVQDAVLVGDEAALAANAVGAGEPPALESADALAVETAAVAASEGDVRGGEEVEDSETRVWDVQPGLARETVPPDHLVSAAEIPHKWLRLEVTWPTFRFDPNADAKALAEAAVAFAAELSEALRVRVARWIEDEDPLHGGRAWAMPRATDANPWHKVRPTDVVDWETTLTKLRAVPGARATPDLDLRVELSVVADVRTRASAYLERPRIPLLRGWLSAPAARASNSFSIKPPTTRVATKAKATMGDETSNMGTPRRLQYRKGHFGSRAIPALLDRVSDRCAISRGPQ